MSIEYTIFVPINIGIVLNLIVLLTIGGSGLSLYVARVTLEQIERLISRQKFRSQGKLITCFKFKACTLEFYCIHYIKI